SLLGAGLTRRLGVKPIYLLGLLADLASMALLYFSQFAAGQASLAYPLLLLATGSLGSGFGLTVPALNTLAAGLFPREGDRAVLVLNALLGAGTVLAPVLVAVFLGLGIWWGLPLLAGALLLALLLFSLRLPLQVSAPGPAPGKSRLPARFWAYAGFAVL